MTTQNFEQLADDYAVAKARADEAKDAVEKIRKQILELAGEKVVGQHFTVSKTTYVRPDLDREALDEFVKRPVIAEYIACHDISLKKETSVTTLRVKASV